MATREATDGVAFGSYSRCANAAAFHLRGPDRFVAGVECPPTLCYSSARYSPFRNVSMAAKPISLAADHAGFPLKQAVRACLARRGLDVLDLGTDDERPVDYPDFANALAGKLAAGVSERGILICGSGVGMSIAANRHSGIRAALVRDAEDARLARRHNDANVLILAGRRSSEAAARRCVAAFLETDFEGGRHRRRLDKLAVGAPASAAGWQ